MSGFEYERLKLPLTARLAAVLVSYYVKANSRSGLKN
jgi:hypothetical protein